VCGRWWSTPAGDQRDVDWTSLSRKHAIETDRARRLVTVFGGKLTDCLNVGEEVAEAVESLGVPLRRTSRTGTASRRRPPAPSSTARPA
jgi:glycerol-3-phosphate dehydrogenase